MREGTGRSASRRLPGGLRSAGKTGTTDDLRDSWFAGFAGDRLAVVWLGHDDNTPAGLTGASGALSVWTELMRRLGPTSLEASPPPGIEWHWVDLQSGHRTPAGCPAARKLPFVAGSEPASGRCSARAAASERSNG
jgi:penicillin-binding protein 1B